MKNKLVHPIKTFLISLFCIVISSTVSSQNYFKLIDAPLGSYYQRITDFPNGDILVCDRRHDEAQPFAAKGAYLIRLNECGEIVWAKNYQNEGWTFSFDFVKTNETGEIFILGNWYLWTDFQTAILKLDTDGNLLTFKTFDMPEALFHNDYEMHLKDGRIMVLSFFQTPAGEKYHHVFTLNEDLEWIWNKRISYYEAYGESTMTDDLGILFQTGNSYIRLNADGEVEWAKKLASTTGLYLLTRPLSVADGYIIGNYEIDGKCSFFKIDKSGNLLWQSKKFATFYLVPELKLLPDDDVLVTYNYPSPEGTLPAYLILSATGELSNQRRLSIDFYLNSGFTYPILHADGRVNILGNAQMSYSLDHHFKDFILQFNLNNPDGECFSWDILDEAIDYDRELIFSDLDVTQTDINLQMETQTSLIVEEIDVLLEEVCPLEPAINTVFSDTLVNCADNWTVALPDEDFIWEDGYTDNPRILKLPGIYSARKTNCLEDIMHHFELVKNECTCDIYIPNVFSPNQDGANDELEIYSDCEILQINMQVFNRWGGLLFSSNEVNASWDGQFEGKKVNSGAYILKMTAQVQDGIGQIYPFEKFQSILIL